MEVLGDALVEMRRAPDSRLLLEVALMKLSSPADPSNLSGLVARLERLEQAVARGVAPAGAAPASPPPPVDPTTGRAKLGGAASANTGPIQRPAQPAQPTQPVQSAQPKQSAPHPEPRKAPPPTLNKQAAVPSSGSGSPTEVWPAVLTSLKPLVRALYSACAVSSPSPDKVVLSAPNAVHQSKCAEHAAVVAAAFENVAGLTVAVEVVVGESGDRIRSGTPRTAPNRGTPQRDTSQRDTMPDDEFDNHNIDPNELSDMPTVPVESPLDRITKAFPGSRLVTDTDKK